MPRSRQLFDELIPEIQNRVFKRSIVLGSPCRLLVDRFVDATGKGNVQHVGLAVPVVAIDLLPVALGGERDGRFSHQRLAIVSILVSPNTIDLSSSGWQRKRSKGDCLTSWSPQTTAMTLSGCTL